MKRSKKAWNVCIVLFCLICVISFSPLIIPQNNIHPELLGIPFSLWSGFLLTVALVVLTYIGTRVHPGGDKEEAES